MRTLLLRYYFSPSVAVAATAPIEEDYTIKLN